MFLTLSVIITLTLYALYLFILYYLHMLEKTGCICAMDWRRNFTMIYYILFFVLGIAAIFTGDRKISAGIVSLMFIASIANSIIMLQYVQELKLKKCDCSDEVGRKIMQVIAYLQLFLVAAALFTAVYFMLHIQEALKNGVGAVNKVTKKLTKSIKK